MKMMTKLMLVLAIAFLASNAYGLGSWSLVGDFAPAPGGNPNGPWSYVEAATNGPPSSIGALMDYDDTVWDWGHPGWIQPGGDPAGSGTPPALAAGPHQELNADELAAHGPLAFVWTSPISGPIEMSGWMGQLTTNHIRMQYTLQHQPFGAPASFFIDLTNSPMPEYDTIFTRTIRDDGRALAVVDLGAGSGGSGALSMFIGAGDKLILTANSIAQAANPGVDGPAFWWDTVVGVAWDINEVPEPATLSLLGLGGLALLRRRKKA